MLHVRLVLHSNSDASLKICKPGVDGSQQLNRLISDEGACAGVVCWRVGPLDKSLPQIVFHRCVGLNAGVLMGAY